MEERNLDFEIGLRREQWEELGRRAASMGRDIAGYEWAGDTDRILVYMTDEEARGRWSDLLSAEREYGESSVRIAEFRYNDGRPYAHVEGAVSVQPPVVRPEEVRAMEVGMERFVREKWHRLMEEAGLHFERGHTSPEVG